MKYAQNVGKYMRLRQELAVAGHAAGSEPSYVARLRAEITALERSMALPLRPADAEWARGCGQPQPSEGELT